MARLTAFPYLSQSEFHEACTSLLQRFQQHGHEQREWSSVENIQRYDEKYLKITKPLPVPASKCPTSKAKEETEDIEVEEEDDEEALPRAASTEATASIHYDIILSPTYRIPVLYIHISDPLHRFPPTLDTLYRHLIPPQYVSQMQDVGVLGGITITDHPIESRPVFFIHPCRTAEVMEASVGGSDVGLEAYLVLWIGAMGKCVGLDVPLALALPLAN